MIPELTYQDILLALNTHCDYELKKVKDQFEETNQKIMEFSNDCLAFFEGIGEYFSPGYAHKAKMERFKSDYDLKSVVNQIESLSSTDQKVCLFIGRHANEPLPNEENAVWVSGDICLAYEPYSLKDRLHLCLDFTDINELAKLQGLFDKIVIDQSTCKFLSIEGGFISHFARLLKPSDESCLIFESTPYMGGCGPGEWVHEALFINNYSSLLMPMKVMKTDMKRDKEIYQEYLENTTEEQREIDRAAMKEYYQGKMYYHKTLEGHIPDKYRHEHNEPTLFNQIYQLARLDTGKCS